MALISDKQWQQYEQQGWLKLDFRLNPAELRGLQDRINRIMLGTAAVDYDRMLMQLDSDTGKYEDAPAQTRGPKGATLDYRKIQDLEFDPVFLAFMQHPVLAETCRRSYGDVDIACFRAMFMNKPAHKGTLLPWHQDRWTDLDKDPLLTVWAALDPATVANGCVEVIPASHKLGLINREHPSGFLSDQQVKEHCPPGKSVFVELAAGEVVLLHNWLLHRSDVNRTDIPRRAFSVCYMRADTASKRGEKFQTIFGKGAMEPAKLTLAAAPA